MKRGVTWIILAIVAASIFFFIKMKVINSDPSSSKKMVATKPTLRLEGVIASSGTFQNSLKVNGTILPNEHVDLHPEISGKVTGIYFKEGSHVQKGDLLLKFNDADLQATLQKLQSQKTLDEANDQRQKQMLTVQGISQQEYDAAHNQLLTTTADIAYTQAQIAKTEIHAPFDGVIGLRHISLGDFVTANTEITTLVSIAQLKIEFAIPEQYASLVKNGDTIRFTPEGSTKTYKAQVYAVDPSLDQTTRSLTMRATFDNRKNEVFPGQFATVFLLLKRTNNAILLPTQTVVPDIAGQKIYVLDSGKVLEKRIVVGTRTDSTVEILSGVNPGDTILLNGLQFVTPGLQIQVKIVK